MKFSQRIGKTSSKKIIQSNTMDNVLKNRLFNTAKQSIEWELENGSRCFKYHFLDLFCDFFGDKITNYNTTYGEKITKKHIAYKNFLIKLECKIYTENDVWFFYDFIEWLYAQISNTQGRDFFRNTINSILEEEKSAFVFNSFGELMKISDEVEIEEINDTLEKSKKYSTVSAHLKKARDAFSSRENPDYVGSIRESIFAVEAISKIIVNDQNATLEVALKKIPKLNVNLKNSLDKLYHFRGDQGGVGHSQKEKQESKISEHDSRLILIICHSIVNYLISNFLDENK